MSEKQNSKRFYKKVPANFSKMTDAQIHDWAAQMYDDILSAFGGNLYLDEETAAEGDNMKLPVYCADPDFFAPWSLGADHPTQGRRYSNVKVHFNELLRANGLEHVDLTPRTATRDELLRVHSHRFVQQVTENHLRFNSSDRDEEQAILASAMVGGTLQMVEALRMRKTLTAVNFAGAKHHAQYDSASGFCVFNDFAVAATIASQDHDLRIAIFDIDAHHGDGTENLTRSNPNVLTYSIHHFGIFPGTGEFSSPTDHVYNVPLRVGDGDEKLGEATRELLARVEEFKPDIVFIAAGADGHSTDPLAGLEYSVEGYEQCARILRESLSTMPILIGGAGGYQPDDITPEIWAKFALQIALGAQDFSTTESES